MNNKETTSMNKTNCMACMQRQAEESRKEYEQTCRAVAAKCAIHCGNAQEYLIWLVRTAMLRKNAPGSAGTLTKGQTKDNTNSIPQQRRMCNG